MLQRNDTGQALVFPTLTFGEDVPAGGEIDHPELLPGFTRVTPPARKGKPSTTTDTTTEPAQEG